MILLLQIKGVDFKKVKLLKTVYFHILQLFIIALLILVILYGNFL